MQILFWNPQKQNNSKYKTSAFNTSKHSDDLITHETPNRKLQLFPQLTGARQKYAVRVTALRVRHGTDVSSVVVTHEFLDPERGLPTRVTSLPIGQPVLVAGSHCTVVLVTNINTFTKSKVQNENSKQLSDATLVTQCRKCFYVINWLILMLGVFKHNIRRDNSKELLKLENQSLQIKIGKKYTSTQNEQDIQIFNQQNNFINLIYFMFYCTTQSTSTHPGPNKLRLWLALGSTFEKSRGSNFCS